MTTTSSHRPSLRPTSFSTPTISKPTARCKAIEAALLLTMRAIYHHSTAQGKTAIEAEPDGKAAEEIAALWTWTSERVNLPTSKQGRKKRG